jgi:hypothetical protein
MALQKNPMWLGSKMMAYSIGRISEEMADD